MYCRTPNRLILLSLLPPLLLSVACKRAEEKVVTISCNINLDGVSIGDGSNFFDNQMEYLIFSYLYMTMNDLTIRSIIADKAVPAEGEREWRLTLKEGALFHDGTPLSARDVALSLEKQKEKEPSLQNIKEASVVSEGEVRLLLHEPAADIRDLLDGVPIYPSGLLKSGGGIQEWREALLKNPVGSGPFRFDRWRPGGIELIANLDYFEGRPGVDRVVFICEEDEEKRLARLLGGEADVLAPASPKTVRFLRGDGSFEVGSYIGMQTIALFLNMNSPLFSDIRVRRAMGMAVDRRLLIERAIEGAGAPAYGPFPKQFLPEGYKPEIWAYDPGGAVQLLREAGWITKKPGETAMKGKDKFRFRLLYYQEEGQLKRAADMIARQLFEVGIQAETAPVSYAAFMEERFPNMSYDAVLFNFGVFSPGTVWQSRSAFGAGSCNFSGYCNMEADRLLGLLRPGMPIEKERELNAEIDRIIRLDTPAVFLYNPVAYSASNRRIKGGRRLATGPDLFQIKDWELE